MSDVGVVTRGVKTARQLQPTEVDEVVGAYEAGATTQALGARFEVWRATIGRHLKARGVDTRPAALQPDDVQQAVDLYRAGWTLARLGRRYDVAPNTVRRHLLTAGVTMRLRGRNTTIEVKYRH